MQWMNVDRLDYYQEQTERTALIATHYESSANIVIYYSVTKSYAVFTKWNLLGFFVVVDKFVLMVYLLLCISAT